MAPAHSLTGHRLIPLIEVICLILAPMLSRAIVNGKVSPIVKSLVGYKSIRRQLVVSVKTHSNVSKMANHGNKLPVMTCVRHFSYETELSGILKEEIEAEVT